MHIPPWLVTYTSKPLPLLPWKIFSISIAYSIDPFITLDIATAKDADDPSPELIGTSESTSIMDGLIFKIRAT